LQNTINLFYLKNILKWNLLQRKSLSIKRRVIRPKMLLMAMKHRLRSQNREEIERKRLSKRMVKPSQLQLEMELNQLMEKAPKKRNLDKERKESQETLKRPMVEINQRQNIESRVKRVKKRARLKKHQQKEVARRREEITNPKMPKKLMDLPSQNIE
jgi:hypothetical protein